MLQIREQLRELRTQFTDKERRSQDVAAILPEAIKLSRERNDELARGPRTRGSNVLTTLRTRAWHKSRQSSRTSNRLLR